MVDIFIDPNDVSPLANRSPYKKVQKKNEVGEEGFDKVLSEKVNQKPTPFLTPDDLKDSSLSKPRQPREHPTPSTPSTTQSQNSSSIEIKHHIAPEENHTNPRQTQAHKSLEANSLRDLMSRHPLKVETTSIDQTEPAKPETTEPREEPTNAAQDPQKVNVVDKEDTSTTAEYTVRQGDTLSEIVARFMKDHGISFTSSELYKTVQSVASANGISNPDLIYSGTRLNLSPALENTQEKPKQEVLSGSNHLYPPTQGRITSEFGMRDHPILEGERFHTGVDIAVPVGTSIKTIDSGTVTFAGNRGGYGLMVEIDHGNDMISRYGHLSEILVEAGDNITSNQDIALSGQTGHSTGPHLHFEVRHKESPIDPLSMLARERIERIPRV